MRICLLTLFVGFLFQSCNSETQVGLVLFSDKDIDVIDLNSVELQGICDSVINSNYSLVIKDKLFLNEMGPSGIYHAIDLTNEKYLGLYGEKGNGPGELAVPSLLNAFGEKQLQIFDLQQKKIVIFNTENMDEGFVHEFGLLEINTPYTAFIHDTLVYNTSFTDASGSIFVNNLNGKEVIKLGDLPYSGPNMPENTIAEGHSSRLQGNNEILVKCYVTAPIIEIFDLDTNELVTTIKGPEEFQSSFTTNPSSEMIALAYTEDTRLGFTDVKLSNSYIYALYSGKKLFEQHSDINSQVYVFDYSGKPIRKYELDKGVISINVYDDKYIYGYCTNGIENQLFKYKL